MEYSFVVRPALFVFLAYLTGSIPFGLLLARLKGKDPRLEGSRNIGATNVLRVAGKALGLLTLVLDVSKGLLPTFLVLRFGADQLTVSACGLSAFLGHLYPIYLGFKGGKGVAVAVGVFLAISPLSVLLTIVFFLLVVYSFRYVSLASICSSWFFFLLLYLFDTPVAFLMLGLIVAGFVTLRHRENLSRLLKGKEPRIFGKGGT